MPLKISIQKIIVFISAAFLFMFMLILPAGSFAAQAEENWETYVWNGDAQELERLCQQRGITSADVFEANDFVNGTPPPGHEKTSLLLPRSKSAVLLTRMEVLSRKSGSNTPMVTVKLHGIPPSMQTSTQRASFSPPSPPSPAPLKKVEVAAPRDKAPAVPDSILGRGSLPAGSQKPAVLPSLPAGKMMWPVSGKISSQYGPRGRRRHDGIDIPMPKGTPIVAARNGTVIDTDTGSNRRYRGYGQIVLVDHGNGIATLYAHCSALNVKKGDTVRQGDVVAFVGDTGRATTHHVHFEVRKNGKAVNPINYLAAR